jgi:CHASE3 domain sensor protein
MFRNMTLGRQIAVGVLVPYMIILAVLCPYSYLNQVRLAETTQRISQGQQVILRTTELMTALAGTENAARGYALSGGDDFLSGFNAAIESTPPKLEELRHAASSEDQLRRIDTLTAAVREVRRGLTDLIEARRTQGVSAATAVATDLRNRRPMDEARKLGDAVKAAETEQMRTHAAESETASRRVMWLPILCVPFCLGVMAIAVVFIIRNLNRQIGDIVQHLRSSAAELQAAATQQVKGAKGQAATATEVATTMRELVTTSRQIADSAQRVTGVATETTTAARTGDHTVQNAQSAVEQVKLQVDRIVTHMLDLGKRSQEIGSILDIINELAEQTNILSINATIEAAGAGDAGRRFAVVADEIRKLADRVGGSTKEIRGLIEEVRAAANTTVMVTEDGSKAVDASARQFAEVAASFRRIVELVGNTTQASREIELSTKQQTTAVEQASTAIADVAQTARDTEASSAQTMQTAAQLATLSQQIVRLIKSAGQG